MLGKVVLLYHPCTGVKYPPAPLDSLCVLEMGVRCAATGSPGNKAQEQFLERILMQALNLMGLEHLSWAVSLSIIYDSQVFLILIGLYSGNGELLKFSQV